MTSVSTAARDVLTSELAGLVALSPERDAGLNALLRATCAQAISLPPLPAEIDVSTVEAGTAAQFAEQFSTDVAGLSADQRNGFLAEFGRRAFSVSALTFIADYGPRVTAGLAALGVTWQPGSIEWDRTSDPADALLNVFAPAVARLRGLDPLTTEIIRLRGAVQHNCRLCRSRREVAALDAGGNESMYDAIERYESSELLAQGHKAALRYVDALIWNPAQISPEVAAGVHAHYSEDQAVELTLDVMRNATNKIAVALGGDAPQVQDGVEHYLLDVDGQVRDAE